MMDCYLHTEFQHSLERAQALLDQNSSQAWSRAKSMLLDQLNSPLLQIESNDEVMVNGWSDDIKCARGLIYHMLGQACAMNITSDADVTVTIDALQKTLELFECVSNEGIKLKFLNVLQQTYNLIGQIMATHRQDSNLQSAIRYLLKAEQIYNFVYECTEKVNFKLPNTSFNNNYMSHHLESISEDARKQNTMQLESKAFAFYINGGLDKSKLEHSYVKTLALLS